MTDQTIPADDVREIIGKMRYHANHDNVRGTEEEYIRFFASQLDALLPTPPTLADMTWEERAECRWMQCDAGPYGRRGLIVKVKYWSVYVVDKETGTYSDYTPDLVTARPDLPRMEWSGTEKAEDVPPVKIGDVIESADDPRISALPVGTVLADCDGETVAKRSEAWAGLGYIPRESEGTEFGPWTVRRIGWEDDPAPTPPNTLTEGSEWDNVDALARACEESGRDQIVVADKDGDVFVWGVDAEWWETGLPGCDYAPHTIIHAGKKADQ